MKITLTVREIFDQGISEWAANEGQVGMDEEFEFSEEEAKELGIKISS